MANLTEVSQWEAGVFQLEISTRVLGGTGGPANTQAQQLANRTTWLKDQVATILATLEGLESGVVPHTHSAADIVSGIFSTARLGSGTADATKFLRGDGTWSQVPTYTLPNASNTILGGIKLGTGLAMDGQGVVNVTVSGGASELAVLKKTITGGAYVLNDDTPVSGTYVVIDTNGDQGEGGICQVTLPTDADHNYAVGTQFTFRRSGTHDLEIVSDNITLNVPSNFNPIARADRCVIAVVKIGVDEWDIAGDLAQIQS